MGTIDKYIENIFKDFDRGDKEVKLLKEEMKAHLYDKIEDLKSEGHSEQESIQFALENFGEENKVADELENIISKQNWFFKIIRIVAVVLFIIACCLKSGSLYYEYINRDEWKNIVSNTPWGILEFDINEKIKNKDSLSDVDKEKFVTTLDKFNKDNHNALYYIKIEKENKVFLEYKKEVSNDAVINGGSSKMGAGDKDWSISYKETDFGEAMDSYAWQSIRDMDDATNNPINRLNKYSFMVFIAFWTIMAMYYLQKNLLRKTPSKLYMLFLIVETCIIFTALTFDDHKDFMILFIAAFTLGNIIYEWIYKKKPSVVTF